MTRSKKNIGLRKSYDTNVNRTEIKSEYMKDHHIFELRRKI